MKNEDEHVRQITMKCCLLRAQSESKWLTNYSASSSIFGAR